MLNIAVHSRLRLYLLWITRASHGEIAVTRSSPPETLLGLLFIKVSLPCTLVFITNFTYPILFSVNMAAQI